MLNVWGGGGGGGANSYTYVARELCVCVHVCACVHAIVCVHVCMCLSAGSRVCVCVCVCVCVYCMGVLCLAMCVVSSRGYQLDMANNLNIPIVRPIHAGNYICLINSTICPDLDISITVVLMVTGKH